MLLIAGFAVLAPALVGGAEAKTPGAPVSLVVWSGSFAPSEPLHGVLLRPDGKLVVLSVKLADRRKGNVTVGETLPVTPATLAAIRATALAAMGAPRVTVHGLVADGSFTSATIGIGGKRRTILGLYGVPPQLMKLVDALNTALPADADLPVVDAPPASVDLKWPNARPCPYGQRATSISRRLSLKDAAERGLLQLSSKRSAAEGVLGRLAGDAVKVDFRWGVAPAGAPIVVRINLEVTAPDSTPWEKLIKTAVENKLTGLAASDGTPISFDLNVRRRAIDAPPTPCFHEIRLVDKGTPGFRGSEVNPPTDSMSGIPFTTNPAVGIWGTGSDPDMQQLVWTHETLHLAGLRDAYGYVFYSKEGGEYPIPESAKWKTEALGAWAQSAGLGTEGGLFVRVPAFAGHGDDMMACCVEGALPLSAYHLFSSDLDWLAAVSVGRVSVHGNPGDLLVNKVARQNLGVAAPLDLDVGAFGSVHADGLTAYCIDENRSQPHADDGYDVLGPARDQPGENMRALQAVLEAVSRRTPSSDGVVPGALAAIWRVTDNRDLTADDSPAQEILADAGVDPNQTFATRHFHDPNWGSSQTRGVTPTDVLPAPPTPRAAPVPGPRLLAVTVEPPTSRPTVVRVLVARIELAYGDDRVTLRIEQQRGNHWRAVKKLVPQMLSRGVSLIPISPRGLGLGTYRLVVTDKTRTVSSRFALDAHGSHRASLS